MRYLFFLLISFSIFSQAIVINQPGFEDIEAFVETNGEEEFLLISGNLRAESINFKGMEFEVSGSGYYGDQLEGYFEDQDGNEFNIDVRMGEAYLVFLEMKSDFISIYAPVNTDDVSLCSEDNDGLVIYIDNTEDLIYMSCFNL